MEANGIAFGRYLPPPPPRANKFHSTIINYHVQFDVIYFIGNL